MARLKQPNKKKDKKRGKGKERPRNFVRLENIFDNPMNDLMADLPEEFLDADEIREEKNETPVDYYEDEDLEKDKLDAANEILFEMEALTTLKTKRAFLAIVQIGNERKSILQDLRFPRFQNQKPDLETKAKILKYIGDYIIKECKLLVDIACSGRDLAVEGLLGHKELAEVLIQDKSLKKKNDKLFSLKTLGEYISKILRFENIKLPNGKTYSLKHFFVGAGRKPKTEQVEFIKFLVGRQNKGDTDLAREYINYKRIVLTSEAENKIVDNYRKEFSRLKSNLKDYKKIIPRGWMPKESAEFYLLKNNLSCEKNVTEALSKLLG